MLKSWKIEFVKHYERKWNTLYILIYFIFNVYLSMHSDFLHSIFRILRPSQKNPFKDLIEFNSKIKCSVAFLRPSAVP